MERKGQTRPRHSACKKTAGSKPTSSDEGSETPVNGKGHRAAVFLALGAQVHARSGKFQHAQCVIYNKKHADGGALGSCCYTYFNRVKSTERTGEAMDSDCC